MAENSQSLSDQGVRLVPDHIDVCSTCGYQAVKEFYPCMRCGQLGITRFVPETPRPSDETGVCFHYTCPEDDCRQGLRSRESADAATPSRETEATDAAH